MNRRSLTIFTVALALAAAITGPALANGAGEKGGESAPLPPPMMAMSAESAGIETAVLAGGCFWGVEAVFESLEGVSDVRSGYAGGDAATANYRMVSSGVTSHAESVEIVFDPSVISFGTLLEVFFAVAHDPTQLNYQGPDHGPQYRSAIFYANENQKAIAESYIAQLDDAGAFPNPIVTRVDPLEKFYPAEEYHQDFVRLNPNYPYVVYWDLPKLAHLAQAYPDLIAAE